MEQCLDPLTLDPDVCPGLTPPPGVQAMDPNAFTLQPYVLAMSIVGLSLVCVAVAIRIYTKWFLLKRMQIEDCKFLHSDAYLPITHRPVDYVLMSLVQSSFATNNHC